MTMINDSRYYKVLVVISAFAASISLAAVTPEERARIGLEGTELTPSGAIRAGNVEGTIPEWKNEPIAPPAGFKKGEFHPDPFADDKVLFTITPQNYQEHSDKLSEGQKKMFQTYPDYFMNIYPSRRTIVYPPYVYDAALKNLDRVEPTYADINMGMAGFTGGRTAWAFPIPRNGDEAILNQASRPRIPWYNARETTTAVATTGDYVVNNLQVNFHIKWSDPDIADDEPGADEVGGNILYSQVLTAPPKLAGQVVLALEPMTFTKNFRKAWAYSPGQRRVKRAPQIIYDNPMTASDGLGTTDQVYGWNGPTDRFSWKLLGRREMYIPYNPYKLFAKEATPDKVIRPDGRFNQDYARYELHRVWAVEGTLKEGTGHDYGKRVYYLDEDSWEVALGDMYDRRLEIWRHWEEHPIYYYDIHHVNRATELQYDMNAHRMVALMIDKSRVPDFEWTAQDNWFTPAAVRRRGIR